MGDGKLPFMDPRWEGKVQPWPGMETEELLQMPFPQLQKKITPKKLAEACEKNLPGEFYKIPFPHSPEQIEEWGPEWLTAALHVAKTLPEDIIVKSFTYVRVLAGDCTKITDNADDSNWGGAGMKVMLSVEYSAPVDSTAEHFFIKIPHKMGNKSERHKISILLNNDFPEVMFNVMFAHQTPFRSPRCYFADINRETTNYIVIQERLSFSQKKDGYEPYELLPAPGKFFDQRLEDKGAYHYYALARSFARMTAWYQETVTRTGPVIDYLFMHKDACDALQADRAQAIEFYGPMEERMKSMREWVSHMGEESFLRDLCGPMANMPEALARGMLDIAKMFLDQTQLLPKAAATASFKKQIVSEAEEWISYSGLCNWVINKVFWELNVLAHPNLQVDNAFYWRDAEGTMKCGLLDFGSVCHMPCAGVLSGSFCGAEIEVMDAHEDGLCDAFVEEVLAAGGVCCSKEDFRLQLKLARGNSWVGSFVNFPKLFQLVPTKEYAAMKSRDDPKFEAFLVRCYGYAPVLSTGGWKSRNPTPHLRKFRKDIGLSK